MNFIDVADDLEWQCSKWFKEGYRVVYKQSLSSIISHKCPNIGCHKKYKTFKKFREHLAECEKNMTNSEMEFIIYAGHWYVIVPN